MSTAAALLTVGLSIAFMLGVALGAYVAHLLHLFQRDDLF